MIPIIGDKANVVAIAPEWLGSEDFVKNNYWTDELYVEDTKTAYKTVGFERYNALSGEKVLSQSISISIFSHGSTCGQKSSCDK